MKRRRLGSTDLEVSVLGFGCAPIASRAGSAQSGRALRQALERGINYFDTADMYGQGGSEEALGRVFRDVRDKIVISTKCGYAFSTRLKSLRWVKPLVRPLVKRLSGVKKSASSFVASQTSRNFEPGYIERSVHDSLRRLRTEYIDLFFLHDPPMEIAERPDAFAKLQLLKEAGKIRYYGVSCEVDVARRLLQSSDFGLSAIQMNVNMLEQDAIDKVFPLVRQKSLGLVARQPFAHGRLFDELPGLKLHESYGLPSDSVSISKLALRFLMQFDEVSSILPSMMQPEHLQANIAAVEAGPLSANEQEFVKAVSARFARKVNAC